MVSRVSIFPKKCTTRNLELSVKISRNSEKFRGSETELGKMSYSEPRNCKFRVPKKSRFFQQFPSQNPERGSPLKTLLVREGFNKMIKRKEVGVMGECKSLVKRRILNKIVSKNFIEKLYYVIFYFSSSL